MEDFYSFMEKIDAERKAMSAKHDAERIAYPRYPEDFVFDEDKSVRWNKEKAIGKNLRHSEMLARHQEEENALFKKVEDRIMDELRDGYGFNDVLCLLVYNKAYEDGHSAGGYEIHSYALEYASFAKDILATAK